MLGDLAQATTPWATRSWREALAHLGHPEAHLEELTLGFRVPGDVIELAARLLPRIAPDLRPPSSVRRARGDLRVEAVRDPVEAVADAVRAALTTEGSVGVIVADARAGVVESRLRAAGLEFARLGETGDVDARVDVVPATLAKGLEFDHVVLLEPVDLVAAEPDGATGLRRLYVCLTRAVSSLQILHAKGLPAELRGV